ncbi:MAG TPA: hypothetical protein PLE74_07095 [Candidatus Cloacimonadota bacterium]|nr:hypothetical protein [Candidatus Cloacimonadota bacterium]
MAKFHFYIATAIDAGVDYYHFDSFFLVVIQPVPNIPIVDHVIIVYANTDNLDFPNITDDRVRNDFKKSLKTTIPIDTNNVSEIVAVENAIKSVYKQPATFVIKEFQ